MLINFLPLQLRAPEIMVCMCGTSLQSDTVICMANLTIHGDHVYQKRISTQTKPYRPIVIIFKVNLCTYITCTPPPPRTHLHSTSSTHAPSLYRPTPLTPHTTIASARQVRRKDAKAERQKGPFQIVDASTKP